MADQEAHPQACQLRRTARGRYTTRSLHPAQERRVYNLTPDMLERILRYAAANKVPSETEAARELLAIGLAVVESRRKK